MNIFKEAFWDFADILGLIVLILLAFSVPVLIVGFSILWNGLCLLGILPYIYIVVLVVKLINSPEKYIKDFYKDDE